MSKHLLKLSVNGQDYALVVNSYERLLDVLRNRLELKGVKDGCSTGDCGVCTVLLNGRLVNSCLVLAVQARDGRVETVEGMGTGERLHPLQETFVELNATQCGYCIPAMLVTAKHLLDHNPNPSDRDIRLALSGVLCRCTGYLKIFEAVRSAAKMVKSK